MQQPLTFLQEEVLKALRACRGPATPREVYQKVRNKKEVRASSVRGALEALVRKGLARKTGRRETRYKAVKIIHETTFVQMSAAKFD